MQNETIPLVDLPGERLRNQHLIGTPLETATDVVRWMGAVQAQDYAGATWALALRASGADRATIDALFAAGAILRTHVMRPTWHFVMPEDIRWMLALTGARVSAQNASYDRKLELGGAVYARSNALLAAALEGGRHRTRTELAAVLEAAGIAARGQRLAHLMMRAELDAVVCSGPLRGKQFTYALLDERVPPARPREREEAVAELAGRYFASHGPATVHDFAWWSGLTMADAKAGLDYVRHQLEQVTVDGRAYWRAAQTLPPPQEPTVLLLPNYDEHIVAYRDHGPSLDPGAPRVLDGWGSGLTSHLVVRNGVVVGGWRRTLERERLVVRLSMHVRLSASEQSDLARAAEGYGRFVGLPVTLAERDPTP